MGQITRTKFGLVKSVNLSNAALLLCHTTPIVVIPGKANLIWLPQLVVIVSDTTAGAYATAATFTIGNGTTSIAFSLANSGLSSAGKDAAWAYNVAALNATAQSGLVNQPVTFSANADPTGGDPANIVQLKVFYEAIPAVA